MDEDGVTEVHRSEGRGIGKIHSKASVGCTGRLQARMGIGGKHGISEEDEGSLGH